jgi:hypothetical protein
LVIPVIPEFRLPNSAFAFIHRFTRLFLTIDHHFQISSFAHHFMIAVKHISLAEFRPAGTPLVCLAQSQGKLMGNKMAQKPRFSRQLRAPTFPSKKRNLFITKNLACR